MQYQREQIKKSCNRQVEGSKRLYYNSQRNGMAIQGALLFVLAQAKQETTFIHLNKADFRSILELETLPDNFNPDANDSFYFEDGTLSDDICDTFRLNVQSATCNFCSNSNCPDHCDQSFLLDESFGG